MPHETHHCKRCGDRIPAASSDGINVVYLGTVGPHSPDVPDDLEGLCLPCLADHGASAEHSANNSAEQPASSARWPAMTDLDCPACDRPAVATIAAGALGAVVADDDHSVCRLGSGEHDETGFRLAVHRE
jgi:hypothetical protein